MGGGEKVMEKWWEMMGETGEGERRWRRWKGGGKMMEKWWEMMGEQWEVVGGGGRLLGDGGR